MIIMADKEAREKHRTNGICVVWFDIGCLFEVLAQSGHQKCYILVFYVEGTHCSNQNTTRKQYIFYVLLHFGPVVR